MRRRGSVAVSGFNAEILNQLKSALRARRGAVGATFSVDALNSPLPQFAAANGGSTASLSVQATSEGLQTTVTQFKHSH